MYSQKCGISSYSELINSLTQPMICLRLVECSSLSRLRRLCVYWTGVNELDGKGKGGGSDIGRKEEGDSTGQEEVSYIIRIIVLLHSQLSNLPGE